MASSYKVNWIVIEVVSNPPAKYVKAKAAASSAVNFSTKKKKPFWCDNS